MRVLGVAAGMSGCSVALVEDAELRAERRLDGGPGATDRLAGLVVSILHEAGLTPEWVGAVGVCLGPGSFTGLRASLALSHGLAMASGRPLVGVTAAEALAALIAPEPWTLLVAMDARRAGRVFLAVGDSPFAAHDLAHLPTPEEPVAVAGDAAIPVAAALAARGATVRLTDLHAPTGAGVARAALVRLERGVFLPSPQPLYVDQPEAKLPAGGIRPAPAEA